jgi:hypothetical protein
MCAKEIRNPQRGNQLVKESDQAVETRGPPPEHDLSGLSRIVMAEVFDNPRLLPNVEMLLFTYGISRDSRFGFSASARGGLAQRVTTVASRLI